jgi:hypothetical protein
MKGNKLRLLGLDGNDILYILLVFLPDVEWFITRYLLDIIQAQSCCPTARYSCIRSNANNVIANFDI